MLVKSGAMRLALWNWWWDAALGLPRAQVVTGVLGVVLAVVAIVYAWRVAKRQFQVMDDQDKVIRRQLELLEEHKTLLGRIEKIEDEQREVLKRQGEIAERQHQIMEEQLAKRSDLRVRASGQTALPGGDFSRLYPVTTITMYVKNYGTKGADGFHWEIFIPDEARGSVKFVDEAGDEIEGRFAPMSEADRYHKLEGHYTHRLFPRSDVAVTTLAIQNRHARAKEFTIKWRIRSEDGYNPDPELGEIRFKKTDDWSYEMFHVPLKNDPPASDDDGAEDQAAES
jgi:hypothetical protein